MAYRSRQPKHIRQIAENAQNAFTPHALSLQSDSVFKKLILPALAICIVVVFIVAAVNAISSIRTTSSDADTQTSDAQSDTQALLENTSASELENATLEARLAAYPTWEDANSLAFDALSDSTATFAFSLVSAEGVEIPLLSDEHSQAIETAYTACTSEGAQAGFLFMDLKTGRGIARNLDATIYGASTFKGPFCTYLCATQVATGKLSFTSSLGAGYLRSSGYYVRSGSDTLLHLITETILYSSNDSYASLRNDFSDEDLSAWLESNGASGDIAEDSWFPHYTTREAARLWLATSLFLETESEAAETLSELFSSTETSFIREALASSNQDAEIAVRNKAGWSADGVNYSSISDNAIISCNGRDYLLCVMTSQAYDEGENVERTKSLIATLFAAREDFA